MSLAVLSHGRLRDRKFHDLRIPPVRDWPLRPWEIDLAARILKNVGWWRYFPSTNGHHLLLMTWGRTLTTWKGEPRSYLLRKSRLGYQDLIPPFMNSEFVIRSIAQQWHFRLSSGIGWAHNTRDCYLAWFLSASRQLGHWQKYHS